MVNLNTKSGENNCYHNINGGCKNAKISKGFAGESGRDWESKIICTFTQDGAQSLCSEYFFEHIYTEIKLQEKTEGLMKCSKPIKDAQDPLKLVEVAPRTDGNHVWPFILSDARLCMVLSWHRAQSIPRVPPGFMADINKARSER